MNEIRIFFTALMFYTRIPCPKWVDHSQEYFNQSIRYFPVIGWIVGVASSFGYFIGLYISNELLGVVTSLISSILLTGALHEDGFADVCDGFGGGWTKERILEIMKDSRVGTYGIIGLILLFSTKGILLLQAIQLTQDGWLILLLFVNAHTVSRFIASSFVYSHQYVRDLNTGMNKPAVNSPKQINFYISLILTSIPLVFYLSLSRLHVFVLVVPFLFMIKWFLGRYFSKWIGGYTGDCLGATQQITETAFFLFYLLIWKFTG